MIKSSVRCAIALAGLVGCGSAADKLFCDNGNCGWSATDSGRIAALADLPETAPPDPSNRYVGNAAAEQLGRKLFFDPRFSGNSTGNDALQRPMPYARAPRGQPLNMSCATCHNFARGGADPASVPGDVSLGASWTDTNSPGILNAAFQTLFLWNGRSDSLWAQATATIETAMGSNRLRAAWTIASFYRADYEALFTSYPLPMTGTIADLAPTLETTGPRAGQCLLNPDCPATCRQVQDATAGTTACWPQFPLDGKPGAKIGCQPADPTEPFGDAYDCMAPEDQTAVTRVAVNFGKAVAAYEARLISRNSPFDQFVADMRAGHAEDSTAISDEAKNGALLFVGKAGCSDCHGTPLLSEGEFYNVGVLQVGLGVPTVADCPQGGVCDCVTPKNCLPWGVYDGMSKLRKSPYLRTSMWSDDPTDQSRQSFVDAPLDGLPKGAFRTPGLRDVALTAPYMHDGSIATLDEVVAHYNRGGNPDAVGTRAARIKPLFLSDQEQGELVAFLKTLTGAALPPDLISAPDLPQ
jgi:cytochrome c peroxidase